MNGEGQGDGGGKGKRIEKEMEVVEKKSEVSNYISGLMVGSGNIKSNTNGKHI